jgi:5'-methylthioadenosine phosphorylase
MHNAVIVGSSFKEPTLAGMQLTPETVGDVTLYRYREHGWILPRHGLPHSLLPHRIDYKANARALADVGVKNLLVTSSVGVMDASIPLMQPLIVTDLFMLDNRLPDGSACTMDTGAHLVLEDGIVSSELSKRLRVSYSGPVVFGYVQGPRTKTRAENAYLARAGVHVNSMTVGPELVLANELGITCAAVVVGHKYSLPTATKVDIGASLEQARTALETIAVSFLEDTPPIPFANQVYRF